MCGRYTQTGETEKLKPRFGVSEVKVEATPAYNIAPSHPIAVVMNENGHRVLDALRWGLVPSWAKDPSAMPRPINAKAETVAKSGMFKRLLATRRCLVPADSYFEWVGGKGEKQGMRVMLKTGEIFAFAGLWDVWRDFEKPDAPPLRTVTIITTPANQVVSAVHPRMPVILAREAEERWLDASLTDPAEVQRLLQTPPGEGMVFHKVAKAVNSVKNQGPECLELLPEGDVLHRTSELPLR